MCCMRFRKRVKIMKGLYLNFSGSGVSVSAGVKGLSLTFGKNGTFLNTGLPGTGLYNRQKISGTSKKSTVPQQDMNISLTLDETGSPKLRVTDSFGRDITDEQTIRKIKRMASYKDAVEKLSNDKRETIENTLKSFIEIYKLTPPLTPESIYLEKLRVLQLQKYEKRSFSTPPPSIESVTLLLQIEAKQTIKKILFWKNKKLREEFVANNIKQRLQQKFEEWELKRDSFNKAEEENEIKQNKLFFKQYIEARSKIENFLNATDASVSKSVEELLSEITLPVDFAVDFEYSESISTLYIDLNLPEIEDMPKMKVNLLQSEKISIKEKSQKELKQEYALCVCGIAFYFAGCFFNISSKISAIQISGYTQRINKKNGCVEDEYVYSVKFDRPTFAKLNIAHIDPIEAILNFENKMKILSTFELKTIEPLKVE